MNTQMREYLENEIYKKIVCATDFEKYFKSRWGWVYNQFLEAEPENVSDAVLVAVIEDLKNEYTFSKWEN